MPRPFMESDTPDDETEGQIGPSKDSDSEDGAAKDAPTADAAAEDVATLDDLEHSSYLSRLKLLLRLLPSTLDHVSDTLVLLQLLAAGRIGLFWTGLAIDLLPGPAAAAQFKTLGTGAAASAMLLVHPLNG